MNTQNIYPLALMADEISSTSTTVAAAIDLANYFDVGKRSIKFLVATNWGSTVAATAETVTVYLAESDTTSSAASTATAGTTVSTDSQWVAVVGSTVTSSAGGEGVVEFNVLISKRYVHARAVTSTSATGIFGVAVIALPHRRFAQ